MRTADRLHGTTTSQPAGSHLRVQGVGIAGPLPRQPQGHRPQELSHTARRHQPRSAQPRAEYVTQGAPLPPLTIMSLMTQRGGSTRPSGSTVPWASCCNPQK
jgi:hypothetical protein